MKALGHKTVEAYYSDAFHPDIQHGHNSDDLEQVVKENVTGLLEGSSFHLAPERDENVRPFLCEYKFY